MKLRRTLVAVVAAVMIALAMLPLNWWLLALTPYDAWVRSLFFGLPALLMCWMPTRAHSGASRTTRREQWHREQAKTDLVGGSLPQNSANEYDAPADRMNDSPQCSDNADLQVSTTAVTADVRPESATHPAPASDADTQSHDRARRRTRIVLAAIFGGVVVLMLLHNLLTDGWRLALTNAIGFGLLALAAAFEYKLGYLKI